MAALDSLHVVNRTLYCGGPSVGFRDWLGPHHPPADLSTSWPQLRDRLVIGTYRGRSAVALACCLLGIGTGDEVLVPAYNCGTEIDAVLHSGARVLGYQVSRRCEIDLEDLVARRSSQTRAVYLIHYFGWEQPMEELRQWCDEHGLLLIEDCALALFSSGTSGAVGRSGDAAIFSLPKTLGFCHGGLLSLAASRVLEAMPLLASAGFSTLLSEMRHSAKATVFRGLERLGLYGALLSARHRPQGGGQPAGVNGGYSPMPKDYYFNPRVDAERALHPRAHAAAASISWQEIVRRRRANYLLLAGALDGVPGVEPLYHGLPTGVCPLSFPLLVPSRDRCARALRARGIAALPWWAGYHREAFDWPQFQDACWLKDNMLTLPVYQGLDDRHLDYIAQTAARVLRPAGKAVRAIHA